MNKIKCKLIDVIGRTREIKSFRLVPEEKIQFSPGQFLQVIFDEENTANRDLNKYLSFSCAPEKDYFEVTKKMSGSEFSQRLAELKPGDTVLVKAPMGNCVFLDEYEKIGFLIGGIGITPVISIVEYIVRKKLKTDVCILYSNRRDDEIAFKEELCGWEDDSSNIHVVFPITDCDPVDKRCIKGGIDKQFIKNNMSDYAQRVIFVFGPPAMVNSMKNICLEMSCKSEMLKMENFYGY